LPERKEGTGQEKETLFDYPRYNGLKEEDPSIVYRKPRKFWIGGERS
jgi:hypothetical protein